MDVVAVEIRCVAVGEHVRSLPVRWATRALGGVAARRSGDHGLVVELEFPDGTRRVERVCELLKEAGVTVDRNGWSTPTGSYALGFYPESL